MTNTTAKHRRTKKYSHKFKDITTKMVGFINRTIDDLYRAWENLKTRYKQVILEKRLKNGLYEGWFTCSK